MPRVVDHEPNRTAFEGGPCELDAAVLARFVAGELDAPFSAAVVEHVRRCTPCAASVTALRIAGRRRAAREHAAQLTAAAAPAPEASSTLDQPRRFTFTPEGLDQRLEHGVGFPAARPEPTVTPSGSPLIAPTTAPEPAETAAPLEVVSAPEMAAPAEVARGPEVAPVGLERAPTRERAPVSTPRTRRRHLALAAAPLLAAGVTAAGLFAGGVSDGSARGAADRATPVSASAPVATPQAPLPSSPRPASAR